jgi:cytochrome oxidase assembly protein ShyY1
MAPFPRFLLTPRKILRHVFVLVIVAGCVVAGFWQRDRLIQVRTYNRRVERQGALPPIPLDALIPPGSAPDPAAQLYRRVTVTGTYDPRHEEVLVGRDLNDNPGNDLLTPLITSDRRVVFVDRGWVPFDLDKPPINRAAPPSGTVTVTGVLFPPEKTSSDPTWPAPVTNWIDLGRFAKLESLPTVPMYIWQRSSSPRTPGSLPKQVPPPPLDEGPHFSYMIQWWLFALVGIVGYPILLRREIEKHRRIGPRAAREPAAV